MSDEMKQSIAERLWMAADVHAEVDDSRRHPIAYVNKDDFVTLALNEIDFLEATLSQSSGVDEGLEMAASDMQATLDEWNISDLNMSNYTSRS